MALKIQWVAKDVPLDGEVLEVSQGILFSAILDKHLLATDTDLWLLWKEITHGEFVGLSHGNP